MLSFKLNDGLSYTIEKNGQEIKVCHNTVHIFRKQRGVIVQKILEIIDNDEQGFCDASNNLPHERIDKMLAYVHRYEKGPKNADETTRTLGHALYNYLSDNKYAGEHKMNEEVNKTTVEIVEECVKELVKKGTVPFTRKDIITLAQRKYPDINKDTVNPAIQGMTINAKGGSPDTTDKNLLLIIERGKYVLLTKENLHKYFTETFINDKNEN